MATPYAPGPNDSGSLSSHEREILARIEQDLAADAGLAKRLGRQRLIVLGSRSPVTLAQGALLVLVLVVLTVIGTALPGSPVLLAVLTPLLVVPWVALCTLSHRRRG